MKPTMSKPKMKPLMTDDDEGGLASLKAALAKKGRSKPSSLLAAFLGKKKTQQTLGDDI